MTDMESREQFNQYGRLAAKNLEIKLRNYVLFEHRSVYCKFDVDENNFIQIQTYWRHGMKINLDNWWLTDSSLYENSEKT